jgi:hypothetical protein
MPAFMEKKVRGIDPPTVRMFETSINEIPPNKKDQDLFEKSFHRGCFGILRPNFGLENKKRTGVIILIMPVPFFRFAVRLPLYRN